MDKFEGYFSFDAHGELTKVADFPCVLLNDPDKLPDSSQAAKKADKE